MNFTHIFRFNFGWKYQRTGGSHPTPLHQSSTTLRCHPRRMHLTYCKSFTLIGFLLLAPGARLASILSEKKGEVLERLIPEEHISSTEVQLFADKTAECSTSPALNHNHRPKISNKNLPEAVIHQQINRILKSFLSKEYREIGRTKDYSQDFKIKYAFGSLPLRGFKVERYGLFDMIKKLITFRISYSTSYRYPRTEVDKILNSAPFLPTEFYENVKLMDEICGKIFPANRPPMDERDLDREIWSFEQRFQPAFLGLYSEVLEPMNEEGDHKPETSHAISQIEIVNERLKKIDQAVMNAAIYGRHNMLSDLATRIDQITERMAQQRVARPHRRACWAVILYIFGLLPEDPSQARHAR
ncbi:hypothetical protein H4Q26_013127 [Puccinia striiformis f. sp. tritici PST-130]|nr:hypothetical protein Pst134EB_029701 [Puccinia striiformis f. sp. tritici]KAI9617261.1 hypothetical protein H4Q26_013127 [Puccinia striiformis f. sp. tritici PST-130]